MKGRGLPLPPGAQDARLRQRSELAEALDEFTTYDGVQWVGMDLHRRRSVLVRMSADGQRLGKMVRFNNDPARLKREIAKAGSQPKVVLETTLGWYWAADALAEAGAEVHLAHPLGVKGFAYRRVKNDEKDAADLADLLRMGRLPEAWLAPPETRELREMVRGRHKLVRLRTSCRNQAHGVMGKLGIVVPMSDLFGTRGATSCHCPPATRPGCRPCAP